MPKARVNTRAASTGEFVKYRLYVTILTLLNCICQRVSSGIGYRYVAIICNSHSDIQWTDACINRFIGLPQQLKSKHSIAVFSNWSFQVVQRVHKDISTRTAWTSKHGATSHKVIGYWIQLIMQHFVNSLSSHLQRFDRSSIDHGLQVINRVLFHWKSQ